MTKTKTKKRPAKPTADVKIEGTKYRLVCTETGAEGFDGQPVPPYPVEYEFRPVIRCWRTAHIGRAAPGARWTGYVDAETADQEIELHSDDLQLAARTLLFFMGKLK